MDGVPGRPVWHRRSCPADPGRSRRWGAVPAKAEWEIPQVVESAEGRVVTAEAVEPRVQQRAAFSRSSR